MGWWPPPRNIHCRYLKRLHDACISRFDERGVKYKHEHLFLSGVGFGYLFWERIISDSAGTITFEYFSQTAQRRVSAKAPDTVVAEHITKERVSAARATEDWPIPICGNDFH